MATLRSHLTTVRSGMLRLAIATFGLVLCAALASSCGGTAHASEPPQSQITLQNTADYTPSAAGGGTDDYHCTLVDPRQTADSMIVSTHFYPGSIEVHHAIFYLVPPNLVPYAQAADHGGKGWTCFGDTDLPHTGINPPFEGQLSGTTPWLAAWAPGSGVNNTPTGTGALFPKGTMVVMQIHYNMLLGDAPAHPKLVLNTVPVNSGLKPLKLDLAVAPPDVPCPPGITGPLCVRSASLADLGKRFGGGQVAFVQGIESVCGRDPANPPAGNTTSCSWSVDTSENLLRLTAHMHLLGTGMQVVLDPGTPKAKTLLDVTDYNFHNQRSYDLSNPVHIQKGDSIQVTCTYNPTVRQTDPSLKDLPPRFVTWGDGSSDEMCLAIFQSVA